MKQISNPYFNKEIRHSDLDRMYIISNRKINRTNLVIKWTKYNLSWSGTEIVIQSRFGVERLHSNFQHDTIFYSENLKIQNPLNYYILST
jgi:hypothetical protein